MAPDPRLIQSDGVAVMGTPLLLLRAAIASGAKVVVASRLGSPAAVLDLLESHSAWLAEQGVEAMVMPDDALAVAAARGAVDAGRPGLLMLDTAGAAAAGCGLWRAGDSVASPGGGGFVIAVGPADTELGREVVIDWAAQGAAVFEPAHHTELTAWYGTAHRASAIAGGVALLGLGGALWSGITSEPCSKEARAGQAKGVRPPGRPGVGVREDVLIGLAREEGVNTIINPPGRDEALPLGLVVGGVGYARLRQVVSELGLVGRLPILRLGMTGPLDVELIGRHARDCRRLVVVDHRRGVLFRGVVEGLGQVGGDGTQVEALLAGPGCSPSAILAGLAPHLRAHPGMPREVIAGALAGLETQVAAAGGEHDDPVGHERLAPPGSALVDVVAVLCRLRRDLTDAQYMTEQHGASAFDLAVFGELDDQSRLLLTHEKPIEGGARLPGELAGAAAMGAGVGPGSGLRPVVFLNGRELFAHGYAAIAAAARRGQDVTFIIHTEEPSVEKPRRRRFTHRRRPPGVLDLPGMLEALGAGAKEPGLRVGVIDPTDRPRLRRLLERSLVRDGVHVILARRRVGPRAQRAQAQQWEETSLAEGYLPSQQRLVLCPEVWFLNTAQRLQLGPLGLEHAPGESGGWMTSASWAWAGRSMLNALANPALGLATVQRTGPERSRFDAASLGALPALPRPVHATQEVWRASIAGVAGAGLDLLGRLLVESGSVMGYQVRGSLDVTGMVAGESGCTDVLFASPPREQELTVAGAPGRSTHTMYAVAPTPGSTDLVLGAASLEARDAVERRGHAGKTGAVVDRVSLPTLAELGDDETDDAAGPALDRALERWTHPEHRAVLPASAISEYLWGHRRYAAWLLMGVVLQRGLAPLTQQAIEQATRRITGGHDARCAQAFDVGRKLAVDPEYVRACLPTGTVEPTARLDQAVDDLAQQFGGRAGPVVSREFHGLVAPLMDRCAVLQPEVRNRLVQVTYRCAVWGGKRRGVAYVRRLCETVNRLLDHDHADRGFELTRRGIEGAARAMIVPDEVYLAALLTSPARYRRDRRRLNVALERGDKVTYRHVVRPEFDLFKRHIAFNLTLGERALRLLARLHVVRRVRTGWYREQRDLRDLFLQTLEGVSDTTLLSDYRKWCEIASTAAGITGRGETRRLAVRDARARLDRLVAVDAKELDAG